MILRYKEESYMIAEYISQRTQMSWSQFFCDPPPPLGNTIPLIWTSWLAFVAAWQLGQENVAYTARMLRERMQMLAISLGYPKTGPLTSNKFTSPGNSCTHLRRDGAIELVEGSKPMTYRLTEQYAKKDLKAAVVALSIAERRGWGPGTDKANRNLAKRRAKEKANL